MDSAIPFGVLIVSDILPFGENRIWGVNGVIPIPSSIFITGSVSWRLALTQFEAVFLFIFLLNVSIPYRGARHTLNDFLISEELKLMWLLIYILDFGIADTGNSSHKSKRIIWR